MLLFAVAQIDKLKANIVKALHDECSVAHQNAFIFYTTHEINETRGASNAEKGCKHTLGNFFNANGVNFKKQKT